jgi:glycosyltransferase involved in cell wall biosynthesis
VKVALVSPSNFRETSFVKCQTEFVKCMRDFVDIDYLSDADGEYNGVTLRKASIGLLSEYDAVHFQWGNNPLHYFEYLLLKKMGASGLKTPVVSTIHEADVRNIISASGMSFAEKAQLFLGGPLRYLRASAAARENLVLADIAGRSDLCIFHSEYAKNRVASDFQGFGLDASRWATARLGIDSRGCSMSREEAERMSGVTVPEGKTVFVSVGFLHRIKSVDKVIRAFHLLKKYRGRDDFYLIIVGDGPERANLKALADRLIPGSCLITGFVPSVAPYYGLADAVVYSRAYSKGEVSGMITEGFSAGKPVICPGFGCNAEYVGEESGFLTARDHPLDYLDAILFFLDNPKERVRRGEGALRFAKERLDWHSQGKRYAEFYGRACAGRVRGGGYSRVLARAFDGAYSALRAAQLAGTFGMLYLGAAQLNPDYRPLDPRYRMRLDGKVSFGADASQLGRGWNVLESVGGEAARWTTGRGVIYMPNLGADVRARLRAGAGARGGYRVFCDGVLAYTGDAGPGLADVSFTVPIRDSRRHYVTVEIVSGSFIPGARDLRRLGVLVGGLEFAPL